MKTVLPAVLLGLTFAGSAGAQAPADYSAFPCLSYSLPCGKAAPRKPVKKALEGPLNGNAGKGKQIAFARDRGNCLACHVMPGGSKPGSRKAIEPVLPSAAPWWLLPEESAMLVPSTSSSRQ